MMFPLYFPGFWLFYLSGGCQTWISVCWLPSCLTQLPPSPFPLTLSNWPEESQHRVSWAFHMPWIVGMTSLEFVRFLGLATTLRARKSTLRGSWEGDILPKPSATSNPSRMVLLPLWIPRTSQWNGHKSAAYLHVYCLHMFNYVYMANVAIERTMNHRIFPLIPWFSHGDFLNGTLVFPWFSQGFHWAPLGAPLGGSSFGAGKGSRLGGSWIKKMGNFIPGPGDFPYFGLFKHNIQCGAP